MVNNDEKHFKELNITIIFKVKIGIGDFISQGKGTMAIDSLTSLKYIYDVFYFIYV